MTPEHIAAVTALIGMLSKINGWQISTLVFLVIVIPWICMVGIEIHQRRRNEADVEMLRQQFQSIAETQEKRFQSVVETQEQRFRSVVEMYEANVALVEKNEQLTEAYREHLGEFKDIILLNTQAVTKLTAAIELNQFCPYVRLEKQAKGVQG